MIRLFSVILVLCLLISVSVDNFHGCSSVSIAFSEFERWYSICFYVFIDQTGHSIDSVGDDYDCDVPPPLSVEPFTCCKVSKPFDHINFPECFAPAPPLPRPTRKIYLSALSTLAPPIPVSEDFHDDYTPPPTRSSIFKKKYKASPYQTSTNRPIWPSYYNPDDGSSIRTSNGGDVGHDGSSSSPSDSSHDYDKDHKYHYYHHHGGSGGSGGYDHWPGKYQHWDHDNNQRQYYGSYRHSPSYGRHRRGAPNYDITHARTSNVSQTSQLTCSAQHPKLIYEWKKKTFSSISCAPLNAYSIKQIS